MRTQHCGERKTEHDTFGFGRLGKHKLQNPARYFDILGLVVEPSHMPHIPEPLGYQYLGISWEGEEIR